MAQADPMAGMDVKAWSSPMLRSGRGQRPSTSRADARLQAASPPRVRPTHASKSLRWRGVGPPPTANVLVKSPR